MKEKDLFETLISDFKEEDFFNMIWGREYKVLKGKADWINIYFSWHDFDHLLNSLTFNYNNLHLVNTNKGLTPLSQKIKETLFVKRSPFVQSDDLIWNMPRVEQVLKQGQHSLKIFQIHQFSPALRELVNFFSKRLLHEITLNAYYTPAGSTCYKMHFDPYNIFILQVEGQKKWTVLSDDGPKEFVLEKGDALFLPAGLEHGAYCEDKSSLHLTLGLHNLNYKMILTSLMKSQKFLQGNLPVNRTSRDFDYKKIIETFDNEIAKIINDPNFESEIGKLIIRELAKRFSPNKIFNFNQDLSMADTTTFFCSDPNIWFKFDNNILSISGFELEITVEEDFISEIFSANKFTANELAQKYSSLDSEEILSLILDLHSKGLLHMIN